MTPTHAITAILLGLALRASLLPARADTPLTIGPFISEASPDAVEFTQMRGDHVSRWTVPGMRTIPEHPFSEIRFSVIADSQGEADDARWILNAIGDRESHFVIHAGDVVEHGESPIEWSAYFSALKDLVNTRFVAMAIGNHDYDQYESAPPDGWRTKPSSGIWDRLVPGEHWRKIELPQLVLYLLDSNLHSMTEEKWQAQLAWLQASLAEPDPLHRLRIAAFHHPPFSQSVHNWDRVRLRDSQPHEYARIRTDIVPLLEEFDVKAVFNGHAHLYERSEKEGVAYVTAGAINTLRMLPALPDFVSKNAYSKKIVPLQWTITHCAVEPAVRSLRCVTRNREGDELDRVALTY